MMLGPADSKLAALGTEGAVDPCPVLPSGGADRSRAVSNGAAALGHDRVCDTGYGGQQGGREQGDLLGNISEGHGPADKIGLVREKVDEPAICGIVCLSSDRVLEQVVEVHSGCCVIIHRC